MSTDLRDEQSVRDGFAAAALVSPHVIVEEHLPGRDHRILVVDGRVVAVAERVPAKVVGDGVRTVRELIDALNADPRRGVGHESVLTSVRLDEALTGMLAGQGLDLTSVPARRPVGDPPCRPPTSRPAARRSTAPTRSIRASPRPRPRGRAVIGLDIAGIDLVTSDIARPLERDRRRHRRGQRGTRIPHAPRAVRRQAAQRRRARDRHALSRRGAAAASRSSR